MNNTIEFKKDCIMKTLVSEITDISLTHDYKILDDTIEGYFDVSGEYKVTKGSIQKEEFMFTIPFTIALSSLIDKNTVNLSIKDFNYEVEKDILHLKMLLNMDYEENEHLESEETMPLADEILESMPDLLTPNDFHNELMEDMEEEMTEEEKIIEQQKDKQEAEKSMENIINGMEDKGFYKYKIYIMREEDTIESIAIKYNVSMEDLREYNTLENINVGDKIIIPCLPDEKDK